MDLFRFMLAKHGVFRTMPTHKNSSNEVILWRAVIDQALHDLGAKSDKVREEAELWFDVLNPDFLEACELAEIQPEAVFEFIERNQEALKGKRNA